ncbi:glycosyl hydrolase family 18 protein [Thermomicrobiaceae bacterium CFH 74404]|uniref:Glycosyl hydrolase family 18 protein n=1 Tax=Thermalbibacter longus TaxID=2951981 RepID=A0AA42B955_9BACT|nr:glycosyl hydrolase family 18 protein [Thermalbibacter longus]MCM8747991.1 glycosyl hydrolase family 18 protein [Thermalbibacter longus]
MPRGAAWRSLIGSAEGRHRTRNTPPERSRSRLASWMWAAWLLTVVAPLTWTTPAHAAQPVVIRWGYYITNDETSWHSLRAHIGQLDIVSPYFYHLNADGTITDFSDSRALDLMRRSGVRIVPMIKNVPRWDEFHATIDTQEKRARIIERLVRLVEDGRYDGIHIDFEAINAADAPLLTAFMRELADALRPRGKLVTQAIAARTSDTPTAWGGAYDYAALGQINDFVVIMAYDFHYSGGSPGPVAPVTWVERVVAYAQSRMPASTILLGIPLYGYDWDTVEGPPASSVRYDQAMQLASRPGATSGYDSFEQEAWVRYTDDEGHTHEVWHANAASVAARLRLVLDDGLGGFAVWRLGHEDPAVWDEIARLNTPATRIPAFTSTRDRLYFPETGHSLAFGFKQFWERSGGLMVFGYPLTEEFDELNPDLGKNRTVQYFERQRFEYHPELAGTPYEVQLGRLGVQDAERRDLLATAPFRRVDAVSDASCDYFPETGHRLCNGFRTYWQSHGLEFGDPGVSFRESLALFGYPISEEFTDPATGSTVQYFERARFEYHPENPEPYRVLLGLLGAEEVRAKGWIR